MNGFGAQPKRDDSWIGPLTPVTASRRERELHSQVLLLVDLMVACLALLMAVWLRSHLPALHGPMDIQTIIVCAWFSLQFFITFHIYRKFYPNSTERHGLAICAFLTLSTFSMVLFLVRRIGRATSRPTLALFVLFFLLGLLFAHTYIEWLRKKNKHNKPQNLLVMGDLDVCDHFIRDVANSRNWNIIAAISDRQFMDSEDIAIRLEHIVRQKPVETVLLMPSFGRAGRQKSHFYHQVMQFCETTGIRLQIYTDWLNQYSHIYLDHIGSVPVLTYAFSPDLSWALLAKRSLDICLSAFLLLITSPIMLLAALLIKLDSPGPVLFKQMRAGKRGRPFKTLKFRTMIQNAEGQKADLLPFNKLTGPCFKMEADPRITRIGRWLRKSSIDELPQLWNVLRGDMSMVGPRPHPVEEVNLYARSHMRRLSMQPGITGLWQVSGRTSIADFDNWVELDVQYIQEWSLWLDVKILFRTCIAVCKMTGY